MLLLPAAASAHTLAGNGLVHGFTHPLLGLDHLLAIVAVGIISVQLSGTKAAIWKLPALFVVFMLIGGVLGMSGAPMPGVEYGVALSVLCFGMVIAASKKLPLSVAVGATALFAVLHGHAHGTEMSAIAQPALYALGFITTTAVLHICGVLVGHVASKRSAAFTALRFAGAGMTLAGVLFLVGSA